jgi:hypothetical protein
MAMRTARGSLVIVALIVAACGGSGFKSATYGYTVTPPSGWTTVQASTAWDGLAAYGHESPEADQIIGPASASSWAVAASTTKDLSAYTTELIAATARDHGDTCPPQPEAQDAIKVGSDPGTLLAWNCGILINLAVAVHNGRAYVFGFRDAAVQASTDPGDRSTFVTMLQSVRFPD